MSELKTSTDWYYNTIRYTTLQYYLFIVIMSIINFILVVY